MRVALLADVHSNLPALEAVLAMLEEVSPDRTLCLGDLVGYNADPVECIDRLRDCCDLIVAGNHDKEVASGRPSTGTNSAARRAIEWTQAALDSEQLRFLDSLPNLAIDSSGMVAIHGCYLNPHHYSGYITSTMLDANLKVIASRPEWPKVGLCGHTHIPMLGWWRLRTASEHDLSRPEVWPQDAEAVLVNPGSVGQPRDGDPRASFVVVDTMESRVECHRVEYDVDAAISSITRAGLPESLGERLRQGL